MGPSLNYFVDSKWKAFLFNKIIYLSSRGDVFDFLKYTQSGLSGTPIFSFYFLTTTDRTLVVSS